jgi:hypothetical protein
VELAAEAKLSEKQVDRWFLSEGAKRKKAGCEVDPPSKKSKTAETARERKKHNVHPAPSVALKDKDCGGNNEGGSSKVTIMAAV